MWVHVSSVMYAGWAHAAIIMSMLLIPYCQNRTDLMPWLTEYEYVITLILRIEVRSFYKGLDYVEE